MILLPLLGLAATSHAKLPFNLNPTSSHKTVMDMLLGAAPSVERRRMEDDMDEEGKMHIMMDMGCMKNQQMAFPFSIHWQQECQQDPQFPGGDEIPVEQRGSFTTKCDGEGK